MTDDNVEAGSKGNGEREAEGAREAADRERQVRQRKRSIAIALSLLFLAVLFYVVTLVKMGGVLTEKAGS